MKPLTKAQENKAKADVLDAILAFFESSNYMIDTFRIGKFNELTLDKHNSTYRYNNFKPQ